MKILVTGATGTIGTAVSRVAVSKGHEVTCIVNPESKRTEKLKSIEGVNIIPCSIVDYNRLELEEKYDVLIHLAWAKTTVSGRDDVDTQLVNVMYTLDAVKLASRCGCKMFIGAGSQAEYGIKDEPLTPELPVNPESGYGIAKYTAGKMSKILAEKLGMRFAWMRILSIYGPDDGASSLISYVVSSIEQKIKPALTKCEQQWDYLYSEDAAEAFLAVAESDIKSKYYVLGSGNGRRLREYVEEIRDIIAPGVQLGFGEKDYYPHQPMYLVADVSELTNDTGWKPHVRFADGIDRIIKSSEV